MPRHLRVLVGAVGLDDGSREVGEAIEIDELVTEDFRVLEAEFCSTDEPVKAEPRTTLEIFADAEEAFGRDPRTALDVLMDDEE